MLVDGIVGVRALFEGCRQDCRSSSRVRSLESGLHEFERSSRPGVVTGGVRAQFETCRRDCRSSNPVRGLESGLEEFEPTSMLVDGIVGV